MYETYVCTASWLLKILISAPFENCSPRKSKLGDLERVGENTSEKPERSPFSQLQTCPSLVQITNDEAKNILKWCPKSLGSVKSVVRMLIKRVPAS